MKRKERIRVNKRNRVKGHEFERKIVRELRGMGIDCGTSRKYNRALDDAKVDIYMMDDTPLNIQCKNNLSFKNPVPILASMPDDNKYNLAFQKVKNSGEYVTMWKDDFYDLLFYFLHARRY